MFFSCEDSHQVIVLSVKMRIAARLSLLESSQKASQQSGFAEKRKEPLTLCPFTGDGSCSTLYRIDKGKVELFMSHKLDTLVKEGLYAT